MKFKYFLNDIIIDLRSSLYFASMKGKRSQYDPTLDLTKTHSWERERERERERESFNINIHNNVEQFNPRRLPSKGELTITLSH